jgi:hypothetical protein
MFHNAALHSYCSTSGEGELRSTYHCIFFLCTVPNQAFRAPGAPAVPPAPPNAKIIFSIVNSRQFTARAEAGHVSAAVINMFRSIEGAKFDWQTCKWLFPLSAHDNLNVSLVRHVLCSKVILLLLI